MLSLSSKMINRFYQTFLLYATKFERSKSHTGPAVLLRVEYLGLKLGDRNLRLFLGLQHRILTTYYQTTTFRPMPASALFPELLTGNVTHTHTNTHTDMHTHTDTQHT